MSTRDARADLLRKLTTTIRNRYPRIPETVVTAIMTEVENRVRKEPPPHIAVIGESGVGKSTTLNVLFNAGQGVSNIEAHTQVESSIMVTVETLEGEKGAIVVYDMPGLGESIARSSIHRQTYERVLKNVDVALWILDAQYRAIESVQRYLRDELAQINPQLINRLVFALNKIDLVHPGERAWNTLANLPSEEQEANIKARISDVHRKISEALPEWRGTVVGYSARWYYGLPQLLAAMIDAVPPKRQWRVAERAALADFFENVDKGLLESTTRTQTLVYDPAQSGSGLAPRSVDAHLVSTPARPRSAPAESDLISSRDALGSDVPDISGSDVGETKMASQDWDTRDAEPVPDSGYDLLDAIRSMSPEEFVAHTGSQDDFVRWLKSVQGREGRQRGRDDD